MMMLWQNDTMRINGLRDGAKNETGRPKVDGAVRQACKKHILLYIIDGGEQGSQRPLDISPKSS